MKHKCFALTGYVSAKNSLLFSGNILSSSEHTLCRFFTLKFGELLHSYKKDKSCISLSSSLRRGFHSCTDKASDQHQSQEQRDLFDTYQTLVSRASHEMRKLECLLYLASAEVAVQNL